MGCGGPAICPGATDWLPVRQQLLGHDPGVVSLPLHAHDATEQGQARGDYLGGDEVAAHARPALEPRHPPHRSVLDVGLFDDDAASGAQHSPQFGEACLLVNQMVESIHHDDPRDGLRRKGEALCQTRNGG